MGPIESRGVGKRSHPQWSRCFEAEAGPVEVAQAPAHEEGADAPVQDHGEPDQVDSRARLDPEAYRQRDPHDPPTHDRSPENGPRFSRPPKAAGEH